MCRRDQEAAKPERLLRAERQQHRLSIPSESSASAAPTTSSTVTSRTSCSKPSSCLHVRRCQLHLLLAQLKQINPVDCASANYEALTGRNARRSMPRTVQHRDVTRSPAYRRSRAQKGEYLVAHLSTTIGTHPLGRPDDLVITDLRELGP